MDVPELWTAILSGQYDLANQMISRGANINAPTMTKYDPMTTLLHYVMTKKSDVQCIHVLASLGANLHARDSRNRTPLHQAAAFGIGPEIIEFLINEGAVVNARDNLQMTPLHHAAKTNCIEVAQKLITRGASINAVGACGWSVLHMAIMFHNLEMVKMLISHRVIIDAKDNFGCTPLLCNFTNLEHKTEITQILLDNGADVNAKTREGYIFPLLLAAKSNNLASLHLLLTRGANVNEATTRGKKTALHHACLKMYTEAVALLLKFGADLNAWDQDGKTPFELLPNSPSSEATAQIIIKEAVKREALGQSLCEGYKRMAQSCETYSRFEQECREEIKRMQNEKIDIEDSAISFFSILSIDEEKLATLTRNEKIVTAFESSGYVTSFRIYAGELTTKFEVAKKRSNLSAPVIRKIAAYVKYGYINENDL